MSNAKINCTLELEVSVTSEVFLVETQMILAFWQNTLMMRYSQHIDFKHPVSVLHFTVFPQVSSEF